VGRPGCLIVIEAMLERMKHEKSVDIYGHVTCMRAQRNYMVQTEDQYIFIHEALLEAATCGNTEVPARNLYAHIQKLSQPPAGETVTAMELEFKVSPSAPPPPPPTAAAVCVSAGVNPNARTLRGGVRMVFELRPLPRNKTTSGIVLF
jgi:hypothetical protein